MSREKQNKGFTLIELIIAIAMLAFLMTAVSMFMTSGLMSYKGAKADIRVHNSAQEIYDTMSNAAMEAKDVYIFGYLPGDDKLYCFMRKDAVNPGEDQNAIDTAKVTSLKSMIGSSFFGADTINLYYYADDLSEKIQIKAMVIDTSTPISELDFNDPNSVKMGSTSDTKKNQLTGESVKITVAQKKNPDTGDMEPVKDDNNRSVYTENDTVRQMFVFDEENMYYMVKYAYATANDDNLVDAGLNAKKEDYLYSSSFDKTDDDRTAVYALVDSKDGSITIDIDFSDKNMTYKTNGIIRFRNSYVLKAKK